MIGLPRAVLGEAAATETARGTGRALPGRETVEGRAARGDPAAHRHAEALLAPIHDLTREEGREGAPQYELGLSTAQLEVPGQATHEVDEVAVEEGRAHLERVPHARAVDLGQDAVLEVELGEELERAVHQGARARAVPGLDGLGVDLLGVDRLAQQLPELRRPEWGEPDRVPERRWVIEAREGALETEVEAHVAVRHGEPRRHESHRPVQRARHDPRPGVGRPQRAEWVVACEELVAPVAPERHGHLAPRGLAEERRRQERGVGQGLVEPVHDRGQVLAAELHGERRAHVLRPQVAGHARGVPALVEARLGEPHREGAQLAGLVVARREQRHGRRVEATREQHPHRHVGHEPAGHGRLELRPQLLGEALQGPRRQRRIGLQVERPAARHPRRGVAQVEAQAGSCGQLVDALVESPRRGHVAVGQVLAQRQRVDVALDAGMPGQRLELRGEGEGATPLRPVERLLAEAIARQEEAARAEIVEREGPHAVEPVHQPRPPLAPAVEQHLGVRVARAEGVATRLEVGAQRGRVVDLAVEDHHEVALGGPHGLLAALGIEHRQAPMPQPDPVIGVGRAAAGVGAAVHQRRGHAPQVVGAAGAHEAGDAAHQARSAAARPGGSGFRASRFCVERTA